MDVLLEWCALDPVDTWEMGRNEVVGAKQGNRNVFIDYPELAWQLFGKEVPANMKTPSGGTGSTTPDPTEPPTTPPTTPPTEPPCTHNSTVVRNAVTATCLSEGYTGDTYCAKCGTLISYGQKIPAVAEHQFGEWKVELEPTETEDGHKIRTCSICNHTETEVLPATGVKETEPGATQPGTTQPEVTDPKEEPSVPTIPTFTSPPSDPGENAADQNSITFLDHHRGIADRRYPDRDLRAQEESKIMTCPLMRLRTRGCFLLTGEEDAQQQAGLPDGINDLCRPVGFGIVIGEFMLSIPAHKAHQSDPGNKKQQTRETDQRSADTCPINASKTQNQRYDQQQKAACHHWQGSSLFSSR